jgi:hypothetical protein
MWKVSCLTNVDCSVFGFMKSDYQFFSVHAMMAETNKSLLLFKHILVSNNNNDSPRCRCQKDLCFSPFFTGQKAANIYLATWDSATASMEYVAYA